MFDIEKLDSVNKDLVDKIYSYIIYPQPKYLLDDIRNLYEVKNKLYEIYTKRYSHEPEEIENWIYNDIICYYNDDFPTMNGYTDNYIEKINRFFRSYDTTSIINYIQYCENNKNIKSNINIYLSHLSIQERMQLLNV